MKILGLTFKVDKESLSYAGNRIKEFIRSNPHKVRFGVLVLILVIIGLFFSFNAPNNFPTQSMFSVEEGTTLSGVSDSLIEGGYLFNTFWFKAFVVIIGGRSGVHSGDYFLESKQGSFSLAKRFSSGDFDISFVEIVIPEGTTVRKMSDIFASSLDKFNSEKFVRKAIKFEGYLFPDTYRFLQNTDEDIVIEVMMDTFEKKIQTISDDIDNFGRTIEEIVIMASLLEEEARKTETRRTISGILWSRIDIGMLLQVDAVFPYIIDKNTFEISLEDLKVDSPYNTYRYKGLPEGPITNPGLDSILSAVTPIDTDYLFYLSDLDGNMHYSKTFEQHKRNKVLYLQ